jgi:tetratricopeptide (TPR) repeat protein
MAVVAALTALSYANAFGNAFVFDDVPLIRDNVRIRSARGLVECFRTSYRGTVEDGLYRPLPLLSFGLNYAISGLQTWSYTALNVLLHVGVTLCLFGLTRSLGAPLRVAGAAALLFGLHPVHVEAVTGFVGRSDTLAALFVLATLLAHRRIPATAGRKALTRAAAWIAFLLALMAKENAITLLAVVPAMDLLVPSRDAAGAEVPWRSRLSPDYVGYGIATAAYVAARYTVLDGLGLGRPIMFLDNPMAALGVVDGGPGGATLAEALLTPFAVVAEYLRLLIWPARLSADYSYDQIPLAGSPLDPRVAIGLAAAVAAIVGAWLLRSRAPVAAFGLAFLVLTFSVTSNIPFKIGTICAERLLYLPSAGFLLAAAVAWGRLASGAPAWRRPLAMGLLAAVALACGWGTWTRNPDWHDDLTLWSSALAAAPGSAKVQSNYGNFMLREARAARELGNEAQARDGIRAAEEHLARALEVMPAYPEASNSLGNLYVELGDYAAATKQFERAATLSPSFPRTYVNWAVLDIKWIGELRRAAADLSAQGRAAEAAEAAGRSEQLVRQAVAHLDRAVRLEPTYALAYLNRAVLLRDHLGQPARAAADFREVLRLQPDSSRREAIEREIARLEGG